MESLFTDERGFAPESFTTDRAMWIGRLRTSGFQSSRRAADRVEAVRRGIAGASCPFSSESGSSSMPYDFLIDTYETERIKVVSVWSEFSDKDLPIRPHSLDIRGRSVHEQMVHQCVSEDLWFRKMLGIDVGAPPLP